MITDTNKSYPYIHNCLMTLLDHINNIGRAGSVYAIEVFNEPEWMIISSVGDMEEGVGVNDGLKTSHKISL